MRGIIIEVGKGALRMINKIKQFLEYKIKTTVGQEKVEWQELFDMYTDESKKEKFKKQREGNNNESCKRGIN